MCLLLSACSNKKNPDDYLIYSENNNENLSYIDSDDEPILNNYIGIRNAIQYFDGYLYLFNGNPSAFLDDSSKDIVVTLVKYNIKTGNITTVCQDPLCSHTTPSCPFSGAISTFYINNSIVYYERQYTYYSSHTNNTEALRQFCSYNLETMKITVHNESEIESGMTYAEGKRELFIDNYCYYYDYVYDEKSNQYIFKICKMDLNTNKISVIGGENNIDNASAENNYMMTFSEKFLFVLNNRIYFTDINSIYSTDLNGSDKQIHVNGNFIYDDIYTDGEYIFYGAPTEEANIQSIHRVNFDGTDDRELGILTLTNGWTITKKYIYYDSVYNKTVAEKTPGGGIQFYSDATNRCDHDGKNNEIVYHSDNGNKYIQLIDKCIIGNYIYANYYTFEDKNSNDIADEGEYYLNKNDMKYNIMRINVLDGEIDYLYMK